MAVHIGQADVSTTKPERKFLMVDSKLMHNRGVNVLNHQRMLDDGISKFVGLPKNCSPLESTPRYKNTVAIHVVISTGRF